MRWYWWAAIAGVVWYYAKKSPAVSYSEAQKLGLVRSVAEAAGLNVSDVSMIVEKDGSLTFVGVYKSSDGSVVSGKIGTFASPDAVNEWVKSQSKAVVTV